MSDGAQDPGSPGEPQTPNTAASPRGELASDPRWQAAMAHLHRGEWAEGIRDLERLTPEYPDDAKLHETLDEARFRQGFDAANPVNAKRWAYPWRRTLVRAGLVLAIVVLLWQVSAMAVRAIVPMMDAARQEQALNALLVQARGFMLAGNWDEAEQAWQAVLAQRAEQPEAVAGLEQIAEERELAALYDEIVAIQASGDCQAALARFGELSVRRSNYKDVDARVKQCAQRLKIGELLAVADTQYMLGMRESALQYYYQVQAVDAEYERAKVDGRIVEIELALAQQLLGSPPVTDTTLRTAQEHLAAVLKRQPRHPIAAEEQRLATDYLAGKQAVAAQDWKRALRLLQPAYDLRPGYLAGVLLSPLYDAYIGAGDAANQGEQPDCALAYEQYRKAAALPVADTTVATARLQQSAACLTPTPTPTSTPEPTSPPPPEATLTPTPTPIPLALFRGKIVFKSDNPERPGFYAMDPDGGNRQYIGPLDSDLLRQQYEQQIASHMVSPDEQYSVYVGSVDGRAQVVMRLPFSPKFGQLPDKPVTRMTGMCYDPVWAPDGSWIAFVTQENESDDVWLIRPDGSEQHSLMRNTWEWDKHPTWSPDSTRLAFWSNREGTKGIYVMDVNGQAVRNISNQPWDEYDPVWIR